MFQPLEGQKCHYYTSKSAIPHLPFLNSRYKMRSLRVSPTTAGVNQMGGRTSTDSAPWPTSDSILNRKLAGWTGVTISNDGESSKRGAGVSQHTKIPEDRGVHGEIRS